MAKIRLLVVDDHEVVRLGLKTLLEAEEDMEVVGEASTAQEAEHLAAELHPDVVIMDVRLPLESGLEACQAIRRRFPRTRVIMLTSYVSEELVTQALRVGASGYVLKNVDSTELLNTIRATYAGKTVLDPEAACQVVARLNEAASPADDPAFKGLTSRELQIIALVARGKSNREIATTLHLSEGTVRNYVSAIMDKLGLRNRIEVATYALTHHLFERYPSLGVMASRANSQPGRGGFGER